MPVISKSAEALSTLNDNYWDLEYDGAQTNFTLITHNAIVSKLVVPLRKKPCSKERGGGRKRKKETASLSAHAFSAEILKWSGMTQPPTQVVSSSSAGVRRGVTVPNINTHTSDIPLIKNNAPLLPLPHPERRAPSC